MYPVRAGLRIPGTVAKVFEIPIKTLACCGAMSRWFTLFQFGRLIEGSLIISKQNLRKSAPSKSTKTYGNDDANDTTGRIKNISSDHHEYCLSQETTTIEVSPHLKCPRYYRSFSFSANSYLSGCQPTLHLAHVSKVTGNSQQNAHCQIRRRREKSSLFQLEVECVWNDGWRESNEVAWTRFTI